MSKIYFVPDVHLQEQSPRSRKDSYPTTVLEKLEFIVEYVNSNKGTCIFLGDLFNAVNMPMNYFYRIVDVFKKFDKVPLTCVGNHDFPRNNEDLLPRTPLGLLNNIGLIDYLQHYEVEGKVAIEGVHYWQQIPKASQLTSTQISMKKMCVAHCFYEDAFAQDHNLHVKDVQELGYDYYILGHDHTPYEDVKVFNSTVYRIGSLTRGTANDKQLTRDNVYILEYDTDLDLFRKIQVPCLPAKEVFNESVFLRKEEQSLDTKKILDNLVFTSNDSIYDVLDRSEQSQDIKDIVEQYLQAAGIFRINKD
jgi:DNA repair exonuclease SbcCD nuclease subunit